MLATLLLFATILAAPDSIPSAPADSLPRRVVRRFPPVEVRALLPDLRSNQTVHPIPSALLESPAVDGLADLLTLEPGVVAQGEVLHVRGGRSGETREELEGFSLDEPLRGRSQEVPLFALRSAELVSGAPEARYGGALAGVLRVRTVDPSPRLSGAWQWQSDGGVGSRYDRVAGRLSAPIVAGWGVVGAGEALLDDTSLPMLRTTSRDRVAGLSFGWRADNHLLGFAKLAPVAHPERFSAQVLVSRRVTEPYSPSWSLDGWTFVPPNPKASPIYSPVELPGYQRYRAADHLAITDDRRLAALVQSGIVRERSRATLAAAWQSARTVTSVGGTRTPFDVPHRPIYGKSVDREGFYVLWGDDPLARVSASDVLSLRGDLETVTRSGNTVGGGLGVSTERFSMQELDWFPVGKAASEPGIPPPLDSLRANGGRAPLGFAYVQGRWQSGGMVMNLGMRAEYWTAGAAARNQSLPGDGRGVFSFVPRLGIAYPISVRDAFSFAYVRVDQPPWRDFLYDTRTAISNRQPLGNPALTPASEISYEAAVKHLFDAAWAMQGAVFYRDVYGQVGAREDDIPAGPINLQYTDQDQSHALGFEWSLIHSPRENRRIEAHYTFLTAWGNESRPEGDPYGPVRALKSPAIDDAPLSWDQRHTLAVNADWSLSRRWTLSWNTLVGSPLPWTPKPLRQPFTDFGAVDSRRLSWSENTNAALRWTPPRLTGISVGLEVRNLFDRRADRFATVDGYPNPIINTIYDDYGAYRTATGNGGGAYWSQLPGDPGHWVPVHDPRLANPPRAVRASVGARW